ncbi:uncharacterized protein LOC129590192 [Paramacrobiotus metropolitanus]|uniref:uncharacterized protein LOC129590192 n=1 Tax=Paramacrobiotus metropolitanus TaxID=2943436 RepID=UPI002445A7A3|nr:uncharacterized protein LOC129590192 [Paramacrobiotus metropolitanus]
MLECTGACRAVTASADNYIVFFLVGLGAYNGVTHFLGHPRISEFLNHLRCSGLYSQVGFGLICALLAGAWLVALEYLIQLIVPQFQISNLALIPVVFLVLAGLGLLNFYVQDNFVTVRLALAILMPMLQVAALHFYVISEFRQCVPLPVLYALIPLVLVTMIWKTISRVTVKPQLCHGASPARHTVKTIPVRSTASFQRPRKAQPDYSQPSQEPEFDYAQFKWSYKDDPVMRKRDDEEDE